MVCLEKTNGYVYSITTEQQLVAKSNACSNPFYLKQMLEVCYRKGCIWFSWKDSAWEYDLDRVFTEFESDSYGEQLNTSFTLKRLQDLPPASRAILAWGSLIGNTFSFLLVQKLLNGEFERVGGASDASKPGCPETRPCFSPQLADAAIGGLQAAMQACILVPTGDENMFRYAPYSEEVWQLQNLT